MADVATLRAGQLPAVVRLTPMAMAVNGAKAVGRGLDDAARPAV